MALNALSYDPGNWKHREAVAAAFSSPHDDKQLQTLLSQNGLKAVSNITAKDEAGAAAQLQQNTDAVLKLGTDLALTMADPRLQNAIALAQKQKGYDVRNTETMLAPLTRALADSKIDPSVIDDVAVLTTNPNWIRLSRAFPNMPNRLAQLLSNPKTDRGAVMESVRTALAKYPAETSLGDLENRLNAP
jgi:hypothetical protein